MIDSVSAGRGLEVGADADSRVGTRLWACRSTGQYPSGARRLTVEHGQPLTEQAATLVQQLVADIDQAVAAAGYLGGGTVTDRPTSITWTFPSTDVPAPQLVIAARLAADALNPGGGIITGDDHD